MLGVNQGSQMVKIKVLVKIAQYCKFQAQCGGYFATILGCLA